MFQTLGFSVLCVVPVKLEIFQMVFTTQRISNRDLATHVFLLFSSNYYVGGLTIGGMSLISGILTN